jgi:lipopolysaccharide/colanic/teichoic acid biosynthesis glycosyltransferase
MRGGVLRPWFGRKLCFACSAAGLLILIQAALNIEFPLLFLPALIGAAAAGLAADGYRAKKPKIALVLSRREARLITGDLIGSGLPAGAVFLDAAGLQEHLLRGAHREIDFIVTSKSPGRYGREEGVLIGAHLAGVPVFDVCDLSARLIGAVRLDDIDLRTYLISTAQSTGWRKAYARLKTAVEPACALGLAVLLSPVLAAIALAVKLSSAGPVLYKQRRTGHRGRVFMLLKFRSMCWDAEKAGPCWACENDERATPLGRILRLTRLDELPQLWNVFLGEMSFVGPRPERPEICERLQRQIPLFRLRTIVKPGITGWAQVRSGYARSIEESKRKLEHDLYYIQRTSFTLDLIILLKTLMVPLVLPLRAWRQARRREQERPALPAALAPRDVCVTGLPLRRLPSESGVRPDSACPSNREGTRWLVFARSPGGGPCRPFGQ